MLDQRPNRRLRHQHQNAAFQAVSGHVADAKMNQPMILR